MQDLDFDEIDRAVNGAIDGTAPNVPVVTEAANQPAPAQPAVAPAPVTLDPSTAPAARRSTGRFMDVVHPSSDMRSRNTVAPREAMPEAPAQPAAEPVLEDEPQVSPFLPDAKVEKRPLGGVAPAFSGYGGAPTEEPTPFKLPTQEQELIEAPDDPRLEAETMPDPMDFAHQLVQPVPEEPALDQPEESIEPTEPVETEALSVEPVAEEPLEEPALDLTQEPAPVQEPIVVEDQPIGPTSITQQYTEQTSSANESGAIYDTEAYHQPLVAPPKKKSGGLVILWISLLVLFGAGVGAAIYYFVLPML